MSLTPPCTAVSSALGPGIRTQLPCLQGRRLLFALGCFLLCDGTLTESSLGGGSVYFSDTSGHSPSLKQVGAVAQSGAWVQTMGILLAALPTGICSASFLRQPTLTCPGTVSLLVGWALHINLQSRLSHRHGHGLSGSRFFLS